MKSRKTRDFFRCFPYSQFSTIARATCTPLAEACRMGALALRIETLRSDCSTCRYKDRMPRVYPCSECEEKYSDAPSKWEPKVVDNGQMD